MTSVSSSQLTLNFEPSLPDRFGTLREFLAYRVNVQPKSQKVIAAEMDMSPSTLSRKLNPQDTDTQRFNLDDLEAYLQASKDAGAVIEYLAAKYLDNDEARKARMINRVESMLPELASLLASLKETTK